MGFIEVHEPFWYGGELLKLEIPEEWDLVECRMKGHDEPPLSKSEIEESFRNPVGSSEIRELAKGKRDAVIVFDDMTRGTRIYEFIPYVVNEIVEGGVSPSHIRFVMALGVHGARTRIDFSKKLGEEIVSKFPVYNHNPFFNFTDMGETSAGTKVQLNSEVAKCDLKIGVGSIVPHPMTGFGGGSKIILPGVASLDTIYHNHVVVGGYGPGYTPHPSTGMGVERDNVILLDMDESAMLAGLDFKVDAIMNGKGETCKLFMGDPVEEHKVGVAFAKKHYVTEPEEKVDIVITNALTKSNESTLALWPGLRWIRVGGAVILISNTPEGQVTHYLYGKFGGEIGGLAWSPKTDDLPYDQLIIYSKYCELDPHLPIGNEKKQIWMSDWNEILKFIESNYGKNLRVAYYPCGEIQFPLGGIYATQNKVL